MQPEDFKAQFDVSRESLERVQIYHRLLLKWQKAINLVSPKTIQESWERHFADSAQLAAYIPDDTKTIVDLGSGAGFPGLVLAMMRPDIKVHLVESDERKAQFLRTVSRETNVDAMVHNARIESVNLGFSPDLITARALSDLSALLGYCAGWAAENPALKMLFLKGRAFEEELMAAQGYDFTHQAFPSQTAGESRILFISDLKSR